MYADQFVAAAHSPWTWRKLNGWPELDSSVRQLALPVLSTGRRSFTVTSAQRTTLKEWVNSGGRFVTVGSPLALEVVNGVFGWSMEKEDCPSTATTSMAKTNLADWYANGAPSQLSDVASADTLCISMETLPSSAKRLYGATSTKAVPVFVMPQGKGEVVWIAFDLSATRTLNAWRQLLQSLTDVWWQRPSSPGPHLPVIPKVILTNPEHSRAAVHDNLLNALDSPSDWQRTRDWSALVDGIAGRTHVAIPALALAQPELDTTAAAKIQSWLLGGGVLITGGYFTNKELLQKITGWSIEWAYCLGPFALTDGRMDVLRGQSVPASANSGSVNVGCARANGTARSYELYSGGSQRDLSAVWSAECGSGRVIWIGYAFEGTSTEWSRIATALSKYEFAPGGEQPSLGGRSTCACSLIAE